MFLGKSIISLILFAFNFCVLGKVISNGVKARRHTSVKNLPDVSFGGEIGNFEYHYITLQY